MNRGQLGLDNIDRFMPPDIVIGGLFVNRHDLVHTAGVTPSAELGAQPGIHNLTGQTRADQTCAQGEHIGIVMFSAIYCGCVIVTHGSPNAADFIGRHATSNACAVDNNAAPGFPIADHFRDRVGKIRIIYCLCAVSTAIFNPISLITQMRLQGFFQREAAMIRAQGDCFTCVHF